MAVEAVDEVGFSLLSNTNRSNVFQAAVVTVEVSVAVEVRFFQ